VPMPCRSAAKALRAARSQIFSVREFAIARCESLSPISGFDERSESVARVIRPECMTLWVCGTAKTPAGSSRYCRSGESSSMCARPNAE
jgi:hypothetical protein